jgi:hypothetical protein
MKTMCRYLILVTRTKPDDLLTKIYIEKKQFYLSIDKRSCHYNNELDFRIYECLYPPLRAFRMDEADPDGETSPGLLQMKELTGAFSN